MSKPIPEGKKVMVNGGYSSRFHDGTEPTMQKNIQIWKNHRTCDVNGPLFATSFTAPGLSGSALVLNQDGKYWAVGALYGSQYYDRGRTENDRMASMYSSGQTMYAAWQMLTELTRGTKTLDDITDLEN